MLAGEEGVAVGTDFHVDITDRRPGLDHTATSACDRCRLICWMNSFFHKNLSRIYTIRGQALQIPAVSQTRPNVGTWRLTWILRYRAAANSTGRIIDDKATSAIAGRHDIPCFLLLDDPTNELFLSAELGTDCILAPIGRSSIAGCWERKKKLIIFSIYNLPWRLALSCFRNDFLVFR